MLPGCDPHQPEVWFRYHQQRQERPESFRDGEDAAQQQPRPSLRLNFEKKIFS